MIGMVRSPSTVVRMGPLLALLLALAGCAEPETPGDRAARVAREIMAQDPQFARYAVDLATRSESSFARDLLVEAVDSGDGETALAALKHLAESADPETEALLRRVFEERTGALRLTAAIGLARAKDAAALDWLEGQIDTATGSARITLAVTLAREGRPDRVRSLAQDLMKSKELSRREEAYALLGELREPWATKLLIDGLGRERGEERRGAIVALSRTGDQAVASQLARFVNTRGLVLESIEGLGALGNREAAKALEREFAKPEPLLKVYAGVALWRIGALRDPEARLGPLVGHEDPQVRRKLAEQLAPVDAPVALSFLVALAEDDDPEVRRAALRSLAERADPGTAQALLARLDDPEYTVSTLAIEALGRVGRTEHLARLEPLLTNENPYVALSAAQAILDIEQRDKGEGGTA